MIPPQEIDLVRERADIVAVIGERLQLTKKGRQFWACCPFHNEKTPSFSVNAERQIFKCFGCQKGGNVFGFLQEYERLSFPEAVSLLADRVGITLTKTRGGDGRGSQRRELLEVTEEAARFYEQHLWSERGGAEARAYLERRGISEDSARRFRLGLAPSEWDGLLRHARRRSIEAPMLKRLGLVVEKDQGSRGYDRFRGRLMFPIRDAQGRVIAFGGRRLDDQDKSPKYINSSEIPGLFEKRRVLYGLDQAKRDRADHLIIVEGYTDAIMAHQAGVPGVVAVLGTAFGQDHIPMVRRFAEQVTVLFDGDAAGRAAARRSLEPLLGSELEIRVTLLPEGTDPCDLIVASGAEAFRAAIDQGSEVFDFLLDRIEEEASGSLAARARAIEGTLTLLAPLEPIRLHLHLGRFAHRFGLSEDELRRKLKSLRGQARPGSDEPRRERAPRPEEGSAPPRPEGWGRGSRRGPPRRSHAGNAQRFGRGNELKILEALVACPERAEGVLQILTPRHFSEGPPRELASRIQIGVDLGQEFSEAALYDQLSEDGQELLGYLTEKINQGLEREKNYQEVLSPATCSRLIKTLRRQQREEIRAQLQEAERRGDRERADELERELNAMLAEVRQATQT